MEDDLTPCSRIFPQARNGGAVVLSNDGRRRDLDPLGVTKTRRNESGDLIISRTDLQIKSEARARRSQPGLSPIAGSAPAGGVQALRNPDVICVPLWEQEAGRWLVQDR